MTEDKIRSVIKSMTYRAISMTGLALIAFVLSNDVKVGIGVGLADLMLGLIIYYLHERIWNYIKWGKQ